MTGSVYTAILTDARTGAIHGELPVDGLDQTEVLDLPGTFSCGIPLDSGQIGINEETLKPWRSIIYLARDNSVLGAGAFVLGYTIDVRANTINLSCVGIGRYFYRRALKMDKVYSGVDQTTIVADLITYAQAQSGGNLGVTTNLIQPTGRLRDRSWYGWERKYIGQLIQDLAAVQDGFHFRYRSRRDESLGRYVTDLTTTYPLTGRVTNAVLELGGNIEVLNVSVDGVDMCNSADVLGQGNADQAPVGFAIDAAALDSTLLLETVDNASDAVELGTLNSKAQQRIITGSDPIVIPTVRIGAQLEPTIGTYYVGDRVRIRGKIGTVLNLDADYLITQTKLVVSTGAEYVDVSFAPVTAVA